MLLGKIAGNMSGRKESNVTPGKVKVFFTMHRLIAMPKGSTQVDSTEWDTYEFSKITYGSEYVRIDCGDDLVALFTNNTFERLTVLEQPKGV